MPSPGGKSRGSLRAWLLLATIALAPGCGDATGPKYGSPTAIALAGGDAQAAVVGTELPRPLSVRVTDGQGRSVPGAGVSFRVLSGGGSVASATGTDSSGVASVRWTLGTSTADTQRVEARIAGVESAAPVTFRASAQAGPPASVVKSGGDSQQGEVAQRLSQMLVVTVKDAYGNPVPQVEVRWAADASTIAPAVDRTDAAGGSRASWTLGTAAAEYAARAAVDALPAASFTARALPGPAVALRADRESVEMPALLDTVRVHVDGRDRYGNVVAGVRGWRSSDAGVVAVDTAGLLRSVGNGTASVIVSSGSAADTVAVTVRQVPLRILTTPAAPTLNAIGDTVLVRARVVDRNDQELAGAAVHWSSSDSTVATVGPGGEVVSRSVGRATIRLSAGTLSAALDVLVRQVLASLRLSTGAAGVLEGDTLQLGVGGADSNGVAMPPGSIAWTSSRPEVASIANGLLRGVRFGATDVTAASGTVTARTTLYVVRPTGRIAAGGNQACALTTDGRVLCWGARFSGALGDLRTDGSVSPLPIVVATGATEESLALGDAFGCANSADGAVRCWGSNYQMQLGAGPSASPDPHGPTRVVGGLSLHGVTAGFVHACALDPGGRAYCWGYNYFMSLGDGTSISSASPVPVASSATFRQLAGGNSHTCGLATDDRIHCWGNGYSAQTGVGPARGGRPQPIAGDLPFVQLASAGMVSCGLTRSHQLYCWGSFNYRYPAMDYPFPTLQPGTYIAVAGGPDADHVCAWTTAMKLRCWGGNDHGQLGIGTVSATGGDGVVAGDRVFVSAALGSRHTCAIASTGEAYCWGEGAWGALGDGTLTDRSTPSQPVAGGAAFR